MQCKAKFGSDPSNRDLKCELGAGHAGWHEYGMTLWANEDEKQPEPRQKARQ